jgi:hypothetical protein
MRIVRWFFVLLVLAGLAFGAAYYFAGRADGPAITINERDGTRSHYRSPVFSSDYAGD